MAFPTAPSGSGHQVYHSRRPACFHQDFYEFEGKQGRVARRLEHDRVSCYKGWHDLPGWESQWESSRALSRPTTPYRPQHGHAEFVLSRKSCLPKHPPAFPCGVMWRCLLLPVHLPGFGQHLSHLFCHGRAGQVLAFLLPVKCEPPSRAPRPSGESELRSIS